MASTLAWGIIGTGTIAHTFAKGVQNSRTGKLAAVGSRAMSTAEKFGDEFKIPHRYDTYDRLLADKDVQAVYIATPHPAHAEWAIKAARAGKHVLCEKPIGINHAEAMAIIEAAIENDVFLMEAFMYRLHPQTQRLIELIKSRAIGEVKSIHGAFTYHWPKPYEGSARSVEHESAGGGILDVGCYPVSLARLIAGVAMGKAFAEPIDVKAVGHLGPERTDDYSEALLRFPGNILAHCATATQLDQENIVRIYGTDGNIYLPDPWIPAREPGTVKMILTRDGKTQEIEVESKQGLYSIEADIVAENIERRQAPSPGMTWEDTLGNMRVLDRWREEVGLVYDMETPARMKTTFGGTPLGVKPNPPMKYAPIKGIDMPVSRLVMGADVQKTPAQAFVLFDYFYSHGGNCFDTAYIYGGGVCERMLGEWMSTRGVRDKLVLIGKGGHTPFCDPKNISRQLMESLERMKTDHVDIYMLHRDNPEIPAGEFVDALNEHKAAGRMKVFGGSNWSLSRVEEANAYAKSKGVPGFGVVSNNFSLARMLDPIWAGCISTSDAASRAWFEKAQLPLLAWSSQARGFFTERSSPDDKSDAELVRCWYSDDNFRRKERAVELAMKKGVSPTNIALAYVLNQSFPTFALFGPRVLSEMRTSLPGLDVKLSPAEVRWLNLED